MRVIFLLTLPAHAAHWEVTYNCTGSNTDTDYYTHLPFHIPWASGASPNTGYAYWTSGQASSTLTLVLTWTLRTGGTVLPPAPTQTIAQITSSAYASGKVSGPVTEMTLAVSDSLDGSVTPVFTAGSDYSSGGCQISGTHYVLVSNPTLSTTVTMDRFSGSASTSGTGPSPGGEGFVTESVTIPGPVLVNLGGTTQDTVGNEYIPIGQHCTSSLSGIPSGFTVSNYVWGVTGTTF